MRNDRLVKGQDLVEYALLVPITLLAILALFDLGRWVYTYSVLSNAAREGARYASVRDSTQSTAIQNYILERMPGLDNTAVGISISWTGCEEVVFDNVIPIKKITIPGKVKIQVTYTTDWILLNIVTGDPPGDLTVNARSMMKMERCLP